MVLCRSAGAVYIWYQSRFADPDYIPIVDENENYVIVNGDRIASLCGKRYGASKITIICQEAEPSDFYLGETMYSMSFVSLSDTEFVLEDDADTQYTFVRIGDTPKPDEIRIEAENEPK